MPRSVRIFCFPSILILICFPGMMTIQRTRAALPDFVKEADGIAGGGAMLDEWQAAQEAKHQAKVQARIDGSRSKRPDAATNICRYVYVKGNPTHPRETLE